MEIARLCYPEVMFEQKALRGFFNACKKRLITALMGLLALKSKFTWDTLGPFNLGAPERPEWIQIKSKLLVLNLSRN